MQRFQVHSHSQALTPTHRSLQPVASIGVQTTQPLKSRTTLLFIGRQSVLPFMVQNKTFHCYLSVCGLTALLEFIYAMSLTTTYL